MAKTQKIKAVGSKAEVFHGTAKHTSGGLKKVDLMKVKSGRIVSRRKHAAGKKAIKRLFKLGFKPKRGTFKLFRGGAQQQQQQKKQQRKSQRKRGGFVDMSGNQVGAMADMAKQVAALTAGMA
jgi:hypothetical protein